MLVCRLGYQPNGEDDYSPNTKYGESKVIGEQIVKRYTHLPFEWLIVRPTSLWGPWFDIPYRGFFEAVRAGWYIHPKNCEIRRSYGFVLNSVCQLERLSLAEASQVAGRGFG
jgi:nucleoside-diphosphate-sugar epimerase